VFGLRPAIVAGKARLGKHEQRTDPGLSKMA
jgi:hypothetical protein